MQVTPQQIETFRTEGWLFLPEAVSPEEADLLRQEVVSIYDQHFPELWREKSGAPRAAFAADTCNEAFRLLGAYSRLVKPVEQIFGESACLHQYKINAKSAFTGEVRQWRRDYSNWNRGDGTPEPKAMNIVPVEDDALIRLARSHRQAAE